MPNPKLLGGSPFPIAEDARGATLLSGIKMSYYTSKGTNVNGRIKN